MQRPRPVRIPARLSIAALALAAGAVSAQPAPVAPVPASTPASDVLPPAPPNLPLQQELGAVVFLSGGVSQEESQAMQQVRGDYSLAIELLRNAGSRNEFTAGAQVRIHNAKRALVLTTQASGPYLWVRLPPGAYKVLATLDGNSVARQIVVPPKGTAALQMVFSGRGGGAGQ